MGRTSHPSLVFFSFSCIFSSFNIIFFVSDQKKKKKILLLCSHQTSNQTRGAMAQTFPCLLSKTLTFNLKRGSFIESGKTHFCPKIANDMSYYLVALLQWIRTLFFGFLTDFTNWTSLHKDVNRKYLYPHCLPSQKKGGKKVLGGAQLCQISLEGVGSNSQHIRRKISPRF